MTKLLEKAFNKASKLPPPAQIQRKARDAHRL